MFRKLLFTVLMVSTLGLATANAEYWCQVSRVASCDNHRSSIPLHGVYEANEAMRSCRNYANSIGQYMCQIRFVDNGRPSGEGYYCQLSRGADCTNNRYSLPTNTYDVSQARRICASLARQRGDLVCQVRIPR